MLASVSRKSALVVIDMQRGLVAGDEPVFDANGLLTRVASLIERARGLGVPVIYVVDDDVADVGSDAWQVHPDLAPAPGEVLVRKEAADAFHETDLQAVLVEAGIGHLVVVGCKTEQCIDTTCRAAISHGYPVTLVKDGHSTTDAGELTAQQIMAHHLHVLDGFGAYYQDRVCEVVARPADQVAFDCARDVPSSDEVRPT